MKKSIVIILSIITSFVLIFSTVSAEPDASAEPTLQPSETAEVTDSSNEEPAQQPLDILELTINYDGSSNLSYTGFIEEIYHEMIRPQYEQMGYKVESIDKDGAKAVVLSKPATKDEPVSFAMPGSEPDDFIATKIQKPFYTMYVVSTRFDMRQYSVDADLLKVIFNIPSRTLYNNAKEVSNGGKTLTWIIHGGDTNPVDMIVKVPNVVNILILVLALLVILFLVFSIVYSNKRKKLSTSDERTEIIDSLTVDVEDDIEDIDSEINDPFEDMTDEEIQADITEEDIESEVSDEAPIDNEVDINIEDEKEE